MAIARKSGIRLLCLVVLAVTAAGAAAPQGPALSRVTLTLKEATPSEAARALSQALGLEVSAPSAEGTALHARLELTDVPPLAALDQVAAAFHGRWRPIYHVRPAAVAGASATAVSVPRFATGRRVTLHLQNAGSRAILTTLALADGGILGEPPTSEGRRISVDLDNVPVETGMDRVTAELGLTWTRSFEIIPGAAPPVLPSSGGGPGPGEGERKTRAYGVSTTIPGGSQRQSQPRTPAQPLFSLGEPGSTGTLPDHAAAKGDLARAISDGMVRVMQMDPSVRRGAIREFARQVDRRLHDLNALTPPERSAQRAQIDRVYRSGLRVYHGLTPDQQQEFRPLFDVLRRWLAR